MSDNAAERFEKDGYAIFQGVFDKETIQILKDEMANLVKEFSESEKLGFHS